MIVKEAAAAPSRSCTFPNEDLMQLASESETNIDGITINGFRRWISFILAKGGGPRAPLNTFMAFDCKYISSVLGRIGINISIEEACTIWAEVSRDQNKNNWLTPEYHMVNSHYSILTYILYLIEWLVEFPGIINVGGDA